ncbi:hypothetical protein ES319_D08G163100v1 [Gossypium barbadense]|uniref:Uncharacterized protein n=2 Tax=Gossypium TaxID=3633 RepID=A0A5J5QGU9_GOSBA|nr:hypothetical protein ES319_D08G163100v1 [Gossypium barbadense]TYG57819.1 hypothetical protein ES288_D08G173200v1 [Gossypium darwinii]
MPLILGDFPIAQNRETVNRENIGDRSRENVQPNSLGDMGEGQATEVASGFADIGVRIIGGKFNGGQRGKKPNRTIRDRGNIFKNSSTQVSFHELLRNLAESL